MKTTKSSSAQAGYTQVAECLFRHDSSGKYYALLKRSGKQIRRSLKTTDRKLAERRLADFREKVGQLDLANGRGKMAFTDLAKRWLDVVRVHLKPRSARTREVYLKTINATFGDLPVRSITRAQCEDWAKLRSPAVSASTFNQETETLRAVLRDFLNRLAKASPRLPDQPLVPILDAKNALDTACKLNGFPHFTHHSLRHFFVSNAIEKGVDFKTITELEIWLLKTN